MLEDLSTSPYAVLGDYAYHQACLRFEPCLETRRLVPTPCSRTMPTIEHVYVPNRAQGLIGHSLCCARELLRSLSNHILGTTR